MSMRRPRIKAAAILPPKRQAREGLSAAPQPKKQPKIEEKLDSEKSNSAVKEKVTVETEDIIVKPTQPEDKHADNLATSTKLTVEEVVKPGDSPIATSDEVFKSPPLVASQKRTESFSASDIENERSDDAIAFRGLQGPLSPVKFRQRIRPTPFFGMRRNSTQGYGSDIEDEPKRQRHTSTSSNAGTPTPQRIRPPTVQRIRTESSCSNISDYNRDPSARLIRKPVPTDNHVRAHAARREFLSRCNGKPPEKSSMKMSDLIYYNPTTNPMVATEPQPKSTVELPPVQAQDNAPKVPDNMPEVDSRMPVPQLKLGPDGEMILDEQSLVIETTAEKEARETLASSKVIYMDEFSGNNGFYRRSKRTKDWSSEETIRFYRCLHTVGTDFSLMLTLFPNRSRRDLKLKFKKEERQNLHLINKALLHPKAFNIVDLKNELDREQREYEIKQKEWEEVKRQAALLKKKKTKKGQAYISKGASVLTNGDFVYETEVVSMVSKENLKPQLYENPEKKKRGRKPAVMPQKSKCTLGEVNSELDEQSNVVVEGGDFNAVDENRNSVDNSETEPIIVDLSQPAPLPEPKKIDLYQHTITTPAAVRDYVRTCSPNHKSNGHDSPEVLHEAEHSPETPPKHQIALAVSKNEPIVATISEPLAPVSSLKVEKLPYLSDAPSTATVECYTYKYIPNDQAATDESEVLYEVVVDSLDSSKLENITKIETDNTLIDGVLKIKQDHGSQPVFEVNEDVSQVAIKEVGDDIANESLDDGVVDVDETSQANSNDSLGTYIGKSVGEVEEEVVAEEDFPAARDIDAEMERFMLNDLGTILTNLINGSLVVVASEDENDPSKVINEIYVMCKETGELSRKPLDLPEDVVDCIVEELNAN